MRPRSNTDADLGTFDDSIHARRLDYCRKRLPSGLDLNNRTGSKKFNHANAPATRGFTADFEDDVVRPDTERFRPGRNSGNRQRQSRR